MPESASEGRDHARRCTLVLLPGMDGTGHLFAPLVDALGPQVQTQVVRYPVDATSGYAELQRVAEAALPADSPCVLLGESFSGPIAIALAAAHPAQVRGLILCCTFVRHPVPWMAWLHPLLGAMPTGGTLSLALLDAMLLGRFSSPELRALLARALKQVPPRTLQARLRALATLDVSAQLRAVTVPTLSLQAQHDRLLPASASRRIVQLKPDAQIVRLEAPHGLLQALPHAAAQAVRAFMESVQAGRVEQGRVP